MKQKIQGKLNQDAKLCITATNGLLAIAMDKASMIALEIFVLDSALPTEKLYLSNLNKKTNT